MQITPILKKLLTPRVKTKILLFIVSCFLFLGAQTQDITGPKLSKESEDEIIELMDKGNIPGLSLIIVNEDGELIKNYGYANVEAKKIVTNETLFELGSCSKAFTALAIIYLENQGRISLDDYISIYIPELQFTFKDSKVDISIEQLLHHTSGIPWNTISKIPQSGADDALERTVFELKGQKLNNLPGRRFEYATINYDVLALIIQRVSGSTFEEFLQDQIINELGLASTNVGFPLDKSNMATGYKIGFFEPREYESPVFKGNNAAGYVISNANDMAQWLRIQLGLKATSLFELIKQTHQRDKTVPLHNMSAYAGGWNVALDGSGEIFHDGLNPNFSSYVVINSEKKIGLAVLANSNSTYTQVLGNNLMKMLVGEETIAEFDPGDFGDRFFSILSIGIGFYILVVFAFIVYVIQDIPRNNRPYCRISKHTVLKLFYPLCFIAPVFIAVYFIPKAIYNFDWESLFVWTPSSLKILISIVFGGVIISYTAHLLTLIFPEKNQFKGKIPQIVLISLLSGLSNVLVIILVTNAIGSNVALEYKVLYFLLIMSVYLLGRRFVQISLIKYSRNLVFELQDRLIVKIFSTSYEKFEKIERGKIYTTLNDDINQIGHSSNLFVNLISSVITTLGAFLYLSFLAFWATLVVILLIISISYLYYYVSQKTNVYFEDARDSRNVFMGLLNGMIDGFKEISLHYRKKISYKEDIRSSANEFRHKNSISEIKFVNAFLVGESLLLILLGITSIALTEFFPAIELATVMSFVIIILYLIGPINSILGAVPTLLRLRISFRRVQSFTMQIPANVNLNEEISRKFESVSHFEVSDIKYSYESINDEHSRFEIGPINFSISAGEVLFIVGGNGSGKTTLAKLLTGLYKPHGGKILINNESVQPQELGEYFSTVFSSFHLFDKIYGTDSETIDSQVEGYLELLDLKDKVDIRNSKYSTLNLSGGQRKRLALLQCYLENSDIYLFDEWAADQDPTYRRFFYRTLIPEMKQLGKIVIAITHDDHYFDVADKVIKMNQGKIEELISHDKNIT